MKTLTTEELKAKRRRGEKFLLVNTLPAESFEKTHIPDSVNIPQEGADFARQVEEHAGGKDQPVVVYCASQECDSSTQGAKKLEAAGFTNVFAYEPGAKGWTEAGEKLAEPAHAGG